MLSIGAFAQLGQVTHRMLRHWDRAGLLVPAGVDESSGYRTYDPEQLDRLHRIVALRHLGFGLDDVALLLDAGMGTERIAALLRSRRAEVEAEHRIATARLADVRRRLRLIEKEKTMSTIEIVEKSLPALRLAARRDVVSEQPRVAGVVGPLFDGVAEIIGGECGALDVAIAEYDTAEDGLRIVAGYAYDGPPLDGIEVIDLPAVETAVCGVHLGPMEHIGGSWQQVHEGLLDRGFVPSGPCRENYVRAESDDQADWVTELQQPVTRA